MRRNRKSKTPPFVMVEKALLQSEAWKSISNSARVVYIHIKGQAKCKNPGELNLLHTEMDPFMSRKTFAAAIRRLDHVGFIDFEKRGGLYRFKNYFRLSERWRTFQNPEQNSRGISPPSTVEKLHRQDASKDLDGGKTPPSSAFLGNSTVEKLHPI
jgi:hypothetical protein